ncbi:hypothetical protein DRI50_03330, partial [candidate division KSB1 bacterium]
GWFYLGAAGLAGAFLAWLFCEPSFIDGYHDNWGNVIMLPLVVTLISLGLGIAESVVERTWNKILIRAIIAIVLGLSFGFIFKIIANGVYSFLGDLIIEFGADVETLYKNPSFWLTRATAWAVFGVAGGIAFGIVSKSRKKVLYGMLGGALGAFVGGLFFDPIGMLTDGGEASRAIGFSLLGCSTGIAIGLVESALKDRWLYVSGGPLAGKEFVLYQDLVTLGKSNDSTIYLFKDPAILEHHATIENRGGKSLLTAHGPLIIAGVTLHAQQQHMLRSGDKLQIGRYSFTYAEKKRTVQ